VLGDRAKLSQRGAVGLRRIYSRGDILFHLKIEVQAEFVFQLALYRGALE
jgi:hypothetical protein